MRAFITNRPKRENSSPTALREILEGSSLSKRKEISDQNMEIQEGIKNRGRVTIWVSTNRQFKTIIVKFKVCVE